MGLNFHKRTYKKIKPDDGNKQKYYKMWEQLAEHYQNYSMDLIFELIN